MARCSFPSERRKRGEGAPERQHVFVPADETGNALIASAVAAWLAAGGHADEPVPFRAEHVSGWTGFRPMDPLSGIWMGVAVQCERSAECDLAP